jgi:hypothetical protein
MNRIKNGMPTTISAIPERSLESLLLNNPIMPSNTASGAKTQDDKTVMLFKKLKVSGEMFSWEAPKFAPKNETDRMEATKEAMPK